MVTVYVCQYESTDPVPVTIYMEQFTPATSGSCGDNVTWSYADGVLTISGTGEMYDYNGYDQPWAAYKNVITAMVVKDGVTNVGNYVAYYNFNALTSIMLADSVTSIGVYAFSGCDSLTTINIPNGVTYICNSAFYNNVALSNVVIPASVEYIGSYAFGGNWVLSTVYYCGTEAQWNGVEKGEDAIPSGAKVAYMVPYTIEYYYDGVLDDAATETGSAYLGTEISDYPTEGKDKYGYVLSGADAITLTEDAEQNALRVCYVKDDTQTKTLSYTVEHVVEGEVRDSQTYTEVVWVNAGDTLAVQPGSLAAKDYTGYKYDSMSPEMAEGDEVDSGTVITLNYVKDESQTKELSYTVEHVVEGEVRDSQTYTEEVWVNAGDTLAVQPGSLEQKSYTGYKYDSITPEVTERVVATDTDLPATDTDLTADEVASGTVITLYYVKDESQTRTLSYTVHYTSNDLNVGNWMTYTETVWVNDPRDTLAVQEGSLTPLYYMGYKCVRMTMQSGTIATDTDLPGDVATDTDLLPDEVKDWTVFTLYYEPNYDETKPMSYTVEHVVDGEVRDSYTYFGKTYVIGPDDPTIQAGDLAAKDYPGYKLQSITPDVAEGEEVPNYTVITLNYVKDDTQTHTVSYEVHYFTEDAEVAADSTTDSKNAQVLQAVTVSGVVVNTEKNYVGYKYDHVTLDGEPVESVPGSFSIEALAESASHVINVYYVIDEEQTHTVSYEVHYFTDDVEVTDDTVTDRAEAQVLQAAEVTGVTVDAAKEYTGY